MALAPCVENKVAPTPTPTPTPAPAPTPALTFELAEEMRLDLIAGKVKRMPLVKHQEMFVLYCLWKAYTSGNKPRASNGGGFAVASRSASTN